MRTSECGCTIVELTYTSSPRLKTAVSVNVMVISAMW